jgi:cholestenol delta-isomerase
MLLFIAGLKHSRPEPLYFWFYFVFMNAIWIVVPGVIILASAQCLNRATGSVDRCAPCWC